MSLSHILRAGSVLVLAVGLFALVAADSIVAANKAADAKKYTEQLKTSKDAAKKVEALQELGKLGQIMKALVEPAVPEIKKALEAKEASVRSAAALAYGRIDPDPSEAVPALVKLLKEDKDESVKIGAAQGLAAMGDKAKAAVKDLREVQKSGDKKSKLSRATGDAIKSIAKRK